MIERAVWPLADLEIRQRGGRGREIRGSFRYGSTATVRDRGRVRKERIMPRAFSFAVDDPKREISLLYGHSFNRPIATKLSGSLRLQDTAEALVFRALLPAESEQPTWVRDAVLALGAGLIGGISPGFSVPPPETVPDAERLVPEEGNKDVQIREISEAVLAELSLVNRPAYPDTEVERRAAETVRKAREVPVWL